ncbi:MAG TPA: GGDEF domain-containing protein [Solirubrobacteraceae bacterium]
MPRRIVGIRRRCYHSRVLEARLRSDRLALAAALVLTVCGALAAVVLPPLAPVLLAPAVVLAATARPAGLLLAPLAAALPMAFAARLSLLAAAAAAAVAAALAEGHRRGLERRALVDPLTGLYRPELFNEALEIELRRVHRYGGEVSLVLLDLDDFKRVNDGHGHAIGNEVLRGAGALLRRAARDSDVAARFGGEELVLLVRGGERSATAAAVRVVSGLRELSFGDGLRVTCSAGVATLVDGGDSASLFASADEALYEAKRRGKDRVVLARRPQVAGRQRAAGAA